jgi:16S rRNA G966 N2-methylase RsmD
MKHRLETRGKEGITFYELWEQRAHYKTKKYVKNIIDFYKRTGIIKSELRVFLRIYNLYFGAVNIFKPIVAMDIYCRYKPQSVLDMTMGWGGRLVGACALNVPRYTGIDLNANLEKSYDEMVQILKQHSTTKITLHFKNALDVDYSKINYDLVLTSPPYYNIEQYEGQKVMEKEQWNRNFYIPLFKKTWKYLKKGGHYCLNIPVEVYEETALKMMGKANEIIPMTKSKRKADEKYKEYIYVWKK